jgi:hypothetical protein
MQHAVDSGDRPRGEGTPVAAPGTEEIAVEVVDVLRFQLGYVEVAEVRLEVAVDDRAGVGDGGSGPPR